MCHPSQLIRTPYDSRLRLDAISGAYSFVDGKTSEAVGSSLTTLGNARPSPLIFYLLVEGGKYSSPRFLIAPSTLGARQVEICGGGTNLRRSHALARQTFETVGGFQELVARIKSIDVLVSRRYRRGRSAGEVVLMKENIVAEGVFLAGHVSVDVRSWGNCVRHCVLDRTGSQREENDVRSCRTVAK